MTAPGRLGHLLETGLASLAMAIVVGCQPSAAVATPTMTVATTITIYFPRLREQDVEFVAVKRSLPAGSELELARSALDHLLQGPTESERALGLSPPLPAGVRLLNLRLEGGVAYPNFSQEIEVGGSVRVMTISQSIRRTLLELPGVQQVVIAVEGKTEGVLQP